MKKAIRRLGACLGVLLLGAGAVVTAQRSIGVWDVIVAVMSFFWIGLPLVFLVVLVGGLARERIGSRRRPASVLEFADTDVMP